MKIIIDGMEIEIKVKPAGSKTADRKATEAFIDELSMVYTHASNFVFGNGMQERADHYLHMAFELDASTVLTPYGSSLRNN